ncbi:carbonic anhydrase-related protein-like isoform X2 [Apostichopus japonicus]|uniref:carbonic anhydrase-related protein-like isoform X2 n=1 Tax=Stichopus japonicus TaxID=307972 RepID=UPI003AB4455B
MDTTLEGQKKISFHIVKKKRKISGREKSSLIRERILSGPNFPEFTSIYHGTTEWGLHFPEASGDSQSPININSREAKYDQKLKDNPLEAKYVLCRESEILNTGATVQVTFKHDSDDGNKLGSKREDSTISYIRGGPFQDGDDYELAACTFHWGKEEDRGSEHTVNFKAYPMELHLIHWNTTKFSTVEDAMGRPGGLAIIALFVQIGRENNGLRSFTDCLESIQYKGRSITVSTPFNTNCLLPDPMLRDFWTYQGSLTSPPCCENVTWILFRYPLTLSISQIEDFRRLKNHMKGEQLTPAGNDSGSLVDNFRPVQPLNKRIVWASFR